MATGNIKISNPNEPLVLEFFINTSDLNRAVSKEEGYNVGIGQKAINDTLLRAVYSYVYDHVGIKINEREYQFALADLKYQSKRMAIYLTIDPLGSEIESIQVTNTLLMQQFYNQRNYLSIQHPTVGKSILQFERDSATQTFTF